MSASAVRVRRTATRRPAILLALVTLAACGGASSPALSITQNTGQAACKHQASSTEPLGTFCMYDFTVVNNGNRSVVVDATTAKLVDAAGRTFDDQKGFSSDPVRLQPGASTDINVHFFVTADTVAKSVTFEGQSFSVDSPMTTF